MVVAQLRVPVGERSPSHQSGRILHRLGQCRQGCLGIAGDRQIYRHETLHILVVRFRQRVSQRNVDDFDVGFGEPAVFVVRVADGIKLPPRICDFQQQRNIRLG